MGNEGEKGRRSRPFSPPSARASLVILEGSRGHTTAVKETGPSLS